MVKWDEFAALVALVTVPVMLSLSAIPTMKAIYIFVYKMLYPAVSQCEQLEWVDVPDGLLVHWEEVMQNTGIQTQGCLDMTLGSTFQQAWVSAPRRNKKVKKPKPLSLKMRYVRIEIKLLKAFLLMDGYSQYSQYMIKFREVDGILTAHLRNLARYTKIHTRKKREIELILEGYPPQYVETIRIPPVGETASFQIQPASNQWVCIPSPIQEYADINRGGWIIAAALHSYTGGYRKPGECSMRWYDIVIGHNMETTTFSIDGGRTIEDFVPRQRAVQRVRHVLVEILKAFPEQEVLITAALEFIQIFFSAFHTDDFVDVFMPTPSYPPIPKFARGRPIPRDVTGSHMQAYILDSILWDTEDYFYRQEYRHRLCGADWSRVMQIFNRSGSLHSEDKDFLRPILLFALQAAARGVWIVMCKGDRAETPKLPNIPELKGHKHVYIWDCNGEVCD